MNEKIANYVDLSLYFKLNFLLFGFISEEIKSIEKNGVHIEEIILQIRFLCSNKNIKYK